MLLDGNDASFCSEVQADLLDTYNHPIGNVLKTVAVSLAVSSLQFHQITTWARFFESRLTLTQN